MNVYTDTNFVVADTMAISHSANYDLAKGLVSYVVIGINKKFIHTQANYKWEHCGTFLRCGFRNTFLGADDINYKTGIAARAVSADDNWVGVIKYKDGRPIVRGIHGFWLNRGGYLKNGCVVRYKLGGKV